MDAQPHRRHGRRKPDRHAAALPVRCSVSPADHSAAMARIVQLAAALAVLIASPPAAASGILPMSGQQQFDNSTGAFLNGGKLYVYQPGTTTCASIFSDVGLSSTLPCPITLNSAGRVPAIYADNGSVRVRILNSASVLQFDQDNVAIVTAATGGGSVTPIPDATQIFGTRDLKIRFDDQPLDGYVRMNGRTIGSASSGATERANADAESLFKELWGYSNVSVSGGKGVSAAADWSANKALVLPDMAGRLLGAMDDLGNGAAGRITSATVSGPTDVGATGGAEKGAIAQGNLPNVAFTVSGITLNDPGHTHGLAWFSNATGGGSGFGSSTFQNNSSNVTFTTNSSTTGITVATQGTAASGGSGTAFNTIAPVMLFTVYLKL